MNIQSWCCMLPPGRGDSSYAIMATWRVCVKNTNILKQKHSIQCCFNFYIPYVIFPRLYREILAIF